MSVYMVSYDIPEGNPSYQKIVDCLGNKLNAERVLESQWLLVHDGDSEIIFKTLELEMQKDDRVFVQMVTGDFHGKNTMLSEAELLEYIAEASL